MCRCDNESFHRIFDGCDLSNAPTEETTVGIARRSACSCFNLLGEHLVAERAPAVVMVLGRV